jgi:carbamoyltransferase
MSHWLLSIHEDSNANATLFKDGEPVVAIAEERVTRVKFAAGFPDKAVAACLDFAGITIDDVDVVLPANKHHFLPRIARKMLPDTEHDYFGAKHKAWLYFQHALTRNSSLQWATEAVSRFFLKRRFPQLARFVDHHTAHAYSAYLTSGFEHCVAVTADNMGDGYSSKVFLCRNNRCEFQYGSSARHSPGQFYGEIAQLLGYHNLMAGKVTGLAAHGDPGPAYPLMEELFSLNEERTGFVSQDLMWRSKKRKPYKELSGMKPANVAAAAQKRLEDVMVDYVRKAVQELGTGDVVLAGGTFANVVVNQRILRLPEVNRVFIHPAMTDQGISMGAGLAHLTELDMVKNRPLPNIYLGPGFSDEEAAAALDEAKLSYEQPANVAEHVAELLAEGRVVARCAGRMEYGLRALGNRSILYKADDPSVNNWLNARLNRTEFMPFAPVTMAEYADECFVGMEGGELAARYMTITFGVSELLKRRSPGVVHLDDTARPQIIHAQENAEYHAILAHFHAMTGSPTIINTSFNMHGEPIVCTPGDAVRAFLDGRLDYLALGPFVVKQPNKIPEN